MITLSASACELRGEREVNAQAAAIVSYNDFNRNWRKFMSDSALKSFPIFADRPSPEFIEKWRQHISETGSPESFAGISTSKPDRSANVVLLSEEIRVPTALRPGGEKVPCPLCSPTTPKFGMGRMAYFPDDGAARFIGNHCAKHYLGDNYTEAERLFRIEAKCAEYLALWPSLQSKLPFIKPVVQKLYVSGQRLSQMRMYINVQAPGFSSFLYNDLVARGSMVITSRDQGAQTYRVEGIEFLSLDFDPEASADKLLACCRDLLKPLPAWTTTDGGNEASKEIIRRGNSVVRRFKEMSALRDLIADASQFLRPTNLRLLQRWTATGASPFSTLTFKFDGDRIDALAESYAGRFNWSVVAPAELLGQLPAKDEITALGLLEVAA
ncbi:hypothetical protein [Sinorhizobium fredii]|uniref:hypothetical protein n=1 Tax=Rhizobium fredii TaxID=380 RepID=UPI00210AE68B|nr:hypothetical protein [Sinorhizobium fredii]UTY50441.1 hypothetical protein EPK84_28655 [Sinorhizobium fredii]